MAYNCEKCGHSMNDHQTLQGLCDLCSCRNPFYTEVFAKTAEQIFGIGNHWVNTGDLPTEITRAKNGKTETQYGTVIKGGETETQYRAVVKSGNKKHDKKKKHKKHKVKWPW